jgi:pimeloyl-ACP methyl ester carboxylesterase
MKVCAFVPTTHGQTYCEVYSPAVSSLTPPKEPKSTAKVILMVHGLGGCVEHFNQSELPIFLADQGHTVVCFDWYSHGKSTALSSKTVAHNLELFHSQLYDVIHCPQLPILNSKGFVAHAFSMGCYIMLQYCVQYEPHICRSANSPRNAKHSGPPITQVILQSPWDGHFPVALRCLLHMPLLLRICKPSDMADIKSVRTLKEILLWMDKGSKYTESLESFARLVVHGRTQGPAATTIENPAFGEVQSPAPVPSEQAAVPASEVRDAVGATGIACPVLVIVGTREPPFAVTARRIAKHINRAHQAARQQGTPSTGSGSGSSTSLQEAGKDVPAVKLVYCKYAGHMSFAKHARGSYVKNFFQREVSQFVANGLSDETA